MQGGVPLAGTREGALASAQAGWHDFVAVCDAEWRMRTNRYLAVPARGPAGPRAGRPAIGAPLLPTVCGHRPPRVVLLRDVRVADVAQNPSHRARGFRRAGVVQTRFGFEISRLAAPRRLVPGSEREGLRGTRRLPAAVRRRVVVAARCDRGVARLRHAGVDGILQTPEPSPGGSQWLRSLAGRVE